VIAQIHLLETISATIIARRVGVHDKLVRRKRGGELCRDLIGNMGVDFDYP
jgi:hypothetical protein